MILFAWNAAVAQLVEQCTENAWVAGSSPACGILLRTPLREVFLHSSPFTKIKGFYFFWNKKVAKRLL
jgi:hypothetical protein